MDNIKERRKCLLKKIIRNLIKIVLLIFVIISSLLALLIHYKGEAFDPVREIQGLINQNRRDEAGDMVRFFSHTKDSNTEIKELAQELEYTTFDKVKSFAWDGVIKGKVNYAYSGAGAIGSDMCIVGDIRDLGIESWNYVTNDSEFDRLVLALSISGLALSGTPFINGGESIFKGIVKYLKRVPYLAKKGVLRIFLKGKLSARHAGKIWNLLKKTTGIFQGPSQTYLTLTT
jgi:hypothetical protein